MGIDIRERTKLGLGCQASTTSALYHLAPNLIFTASPCFSGTSVSVLLPEALMSFLFGQWGWSCHSSEVFQSTLTFSLTTCFLLWTQFFQEDHDQLLTVRSNAYCWNGPLRKQILSWTRIEMSQSQRTSNEPHLNFRFIILRPFSKFNLPSLGFVFQ